MPPETTAAAAAGPGPGPAPAPPQAGAAFLKKTVGSGGREFSVQVLRFENGSFVSVTEGGERIGSMAVSLSAAAGPRPVTTTVIPPKSDPLFIKLVAERASSASRGVAVVSVNVRAEIGRDEARALMAEIAEMTRNA